MSGVGTAGAGTALSLAGEPIASAGELDAATTASSQPAPPNGRVDEELFRLGEPVAASPEVFKAFVDALVEAERRAASAEARLTALEAEVDELRRVVRPEVERADGRRSTGDVAMTLEVFERFLRQRLWEERVAEQPKVPAADVDEAEPAGEEPEAPAGEPEAEAGEEPAEAPEEPEAEAGEPGEEPAEAPEEPEAEAGEPGEEPAEAPAEEREAEAGEPGEEPAEAPAEEREAEAGEELPEAPAEEPEAEPGEPAGEAEISAGRPSESVTATIAITIPPAGSVRVQWDFRSELARR